MNAVAVGTGRGAERRTRAQLLAEATRLRDEEGLTSRQIAERMGKGYGTVRNWFSDPDGSKAKALKASYRGSCKDCGMPTDGSNGPNNQSTRCYWCAKGLPRPASLKPRLCVPFRLIDIDPQVRVDAVVTACRYVKDPDERLELLVAALQPSDTTYWLAESARPLLEAYAA